jgi:hypothetical protein
MEGTSECPGDPWEPSIPKIIVGTLDTRGIAGMFQFGGTNSCHLAVWKGNKCQKCIIAIYKCSHALKYQDEQKQTFAFIFSWTFVRYSSLTLVGATHCVTIPNSARHFFFQGPIKVNGIMIHRKIKCATKVNSNLVVLTNHKYQNSFFS